MDVPQSPAGGDVVTASDLIRQFGRWRERALVSPVYILHRGRPRLVLASVELIERLIGAQAHDEDEDRRVAALLDRSPEMIVIADRFGGIVAASRSVRARFGDDGARGAPVTGLVAPDAGVGLLQAIARVADAAIIETFEAELAEAPERRVTFAIEPHPDGVVLFGRETPAAQRDSFDQSFATSRNAAVARIDAHGFLDGPHTTLATLTGISRAMLSSMRFASLFALEARAEVAAVIEQTGSDGMPRSVSAPLLTTEDTRAVTVSFAPRRRGDSIHGVVALILATNQSHDSARA